MRGNWTETNLGSISRFITARMTAKSVGLAVPYVGLEHVDPQSSTISRWGRIATIASSVTPFDPGDVLFGRLRPYLHKVALAEFAGVCSPELLVLRAAQNCESRFLHLLCSAETTINACVEMSAGTRMPRTSTRDLASIQVVLPPLLVQKRIVDVLASVDAYIAALQLQAAKARTARNAVLHELLTAVGDNWTEATLGELCDVYQPETISKSQMNEDAPYVVYGANGPIGRYHSYNHAEPEVAITCRGATCGVVNLTPVNCWITGNAMVVKPRDSRINKQFLYWALKTSVDVKAVISGSAQPQITRTGLAPRKIMFPSLSQQQQIVDIISSIEALIRSGDEVIAEVQQLRSGLLSNLLSGQHEIPESYDRLLGAA